MRSDELLRLAIPSDGELYDSTLLFLRSCGIPVERGSARRYTADMAALPGAQVLFQRMADISQKVEEGSADLGIVGLDRFLEFRQEGGKGVIALENLGFGQCELVVAVPDAWIDVTSMGDLADLAVEFREQGRELRIATKYPRLAQQFLHGKGVSYFTLVHASGTLEAAPAIGYADVIADITSSGVTLRENHLRTLEDGQILASQACLIGNRTTLRASEGKLARTRTILEWVEAFLRAGEYYSVAANVMGDSPEAVAGFVMRQRELAGVQGPTIAPVYSPDGAPWFSVTLIAGRDQLLSVVEHLRQMGGNGITVMRSSYIFQDDCRAYQTLLKTLTE